MSASPLRARRFAIALGCLAINDQTASASLAL